MTPADPRPSLQERPWRRASCAVCGIDLAGKRADAVTCSPTCRSALRRRPKATEAKMRRPVKPSERPGVAYVHDYGTWHGPDGVRISRPPQRPGPDCA